MLSRLFVPVFASNPVTLMLSRAFTGFTGGICPGVLIAYLHYPNQSRERFISPGSLGWMAGFLLKGLIGDKMSMLFLLSAFFYIFCFLQAFGFREVALGAAVLAILGFLFYIGLGTNYKAENR